MGFIQKFLSKFSMNDDKIVQWNINGRRLSGYGTKTSAGFLFEEYNDKFIDRYQRYKTFLQMDQDNCIYRLRNSIKLSKLATNFYVEPFVDENGKTSPKDEETAKFVETCLFQKMQWRYFMDQINLYIRDGFSLFELFFEKEGKYFYPKLTRIDAYSVFKWKQTNGEPGIQQIVRFAKDDNEQPDFDDNIGKNNIDIPASKLLLFNLNQEGVNYEGRSLYRKIAKDRFIKDKLENYHAVYQERFAVPPIKITVPQGTPDDKVANFQETAENLRSHESGYVTKYVDDQGNAMTDFELMQGNAQNGTMLIDAIRYYEQTIMDSFFAQFLYLGKSTKGSYGLGDASMKFYFHAVKSLLEDDLEIINKYLIPKIVALNFGEFERMPKVKFGNLGFIDESAYTDVISRLVAGGIISSNYEIENYTRELLNLPKLSEEDYEIEMKKKAELLEKSKPAPFGKEETKKEEVVDEEEEPEEEKKASRPYVKKKDKLQNELLNIFDHKCIVDEQVKDYTSVDMAKRSYASPIIDDGRRPLTFAERNVNIKNIKTNHDKAENEFIRQYSNITKLQIDEILDQVKKILDKNDTKAIKAMTFKYGPELTLLINKVYKENFDYGKNEASREIGVEIPKTKRETTNLISVQSDALASGVMSKAESIAKAVILAQIVKKGGITNTPSTEIVSIVRENVEDYFTQASGSLVTVGVSQAFNSGRKSIADGNSKKLYGAQYSAILDGKTSNRCLSLDGRTVRVGSPDFNSYSPPQHTHCRSMWVFINNDEEFKPDIEDIPSTIPVKDTLNSKELLKAPVVENGSPAIRQIKKEIEWRKSKLPEQSGQAKQKNQEIINKLEKSI